MSYSIQVHTRATREPSRLATRVAEGAPAMRSLHDRYLPIVLLAIRLAPTAFAADAKSARTPSGHPDLSGTYDAATLTPLERPKQFGDKLYMTKEEANKIMAEQ